MGRRLVLLARHADTVARLGGDEFVVLCRDLGADEDVARMAERVVCGLRAPCLDGGRDLSVTASVGIAVTADPLAEPERLVRDADAAMYQAKKAGRDCYRADDSARPHSPGTSNLRAELPRRPHRRGTVPRLPAAVRPGAAVIAGRGSASALAPPRAGGAGA